MAALAIVAESCPGVVGISRCGKAAYMAALTIYRSAREFVTPLGYMASVAIDYGMHSHERKTP